MVINKSGFGYSHVKILQSIQVRVSNDPLLGCNVRVLTLVLLNSEPNKQDFNL